MKSFTLPTTGVLNVSFEPATTSVATDENTLKLFPLNGFSSSDFSKTVNIVNAKTDDRQVIKNPVRFRQLEIGAIADGDVSNSSSLKGCRIYSDSITNQNLLTDLKFITQTVSSRIFQLRNITHTAPTNLDLIDNGGNQGITGSLKINNTLDNNLYVTSSSTSDDNYAVTIRSTKPDLANAISSVQCHAVNNTLELAKYDNITSGYPGNNTIRLGNSAGTIQQNNKIETYGIPQVNTINWGTTTNVCTNNVRIQSGAGGTNNLFIGDATVGGALIISGGPTINKITTNMIVTDNATLPTTQAVADYVTKKK